MTTSPPTRELLYVVDTNALIWYLTSDKKLSRPAADVFTAAERGETRLYLSVVVLAELYYANRKWKWFDNFHETYRDLHTKPYFQFVPLLPDEVLEFDDSVSIPEMHDRIIVGLARRLKAPLVTSDNIIAAANAVPVIW